jgi:uncharacterized membrane protein SirB2
MSTRTAWLAWSLAALSVTMFVANVMLYFLAPSAQSTSNWGTVGTVSDTLSFVSFLAFPLVGALIASRRPHNPIGWILLADSLLWMLIDTFEYYSTYGVTQRGSLPFSVAIAALNNWLWVPTVGLVGTYLLLLFPDGKLPSKRWRPLAWLAGAVIVLLSISGFFAPGPLQNLEEVQNPFGLEGLPWIAYAGYAVLPLLPLCILASAASLVMRYRRSGGEVRQQIKWIAFAASFMGVLYLSIMSVGIVSLLVSAPETPNDLGTRSLWGALLEDVGVLSFAGVPVAIGFAVLKYRLYDIDLLINRTLVYGSLTATLVALYFGGIVVLQRVFVLLTGQQSTLAVVASTLLIAALFTPLRRRIQSFIDRRFYRRKYDARKTLEAFSSKLRDETDLDALSEDLTSVVWETMQPAHVTLWLRPDTVPKGEHPD